jgi:hypothetical protein
MLALSEARAARFSLQTQRPLASEPVDVLFSEPFRQHINLRRVNPVNDLSRFSSPVPGRVCQSFALRPLIFCHDMSPIAFSEAWVNGTPIAMSQRINGFSRTRLNRCQSASPRAEETPV